MASRARDLLRASALALVIGIGAALTLLAVFAVAGWLEQLLWDALPSAMGVSGDSGPWTIVVLTVTGMAVGLVVWKVPGHAGPDPATQSMDSPPLRLRTMPSLLLATVIMLAGGPSLGPEVPILALSVTLTIAIGGRLLPALGPPLWAGLATAGMVGALFGTPVAAALILSGTLADSKDKPLWDQLFAPLAAAASGSLTVVLLDQPTFEVSLPAYRGPELIDLLTGSAIALGAAALGLASVYAYPHIHRLFHRIDNPWLMITAGGLVLGLLGAVGGQTTLFRGLEQLDELTATAADYTVAGLALIVVVKIVALLVSATSGFPGGRIFPSVFVGGALGMFANAVLPDIPVALSVAAGVLGFVFAVSREGWISLFIAVVVVGEITLLPIMLVATLPVWLLLTGKPEMLIKPTAAVKAG